MKCLNTLFRPETHIPLHSGPPAAHPGNLHQLYSVPQQPQPVFSSTRSHTTGDLLEGFGQPLPPTLAAGHDAGSFDPSMAASNLANLDLDQLRQDINQQGHQGSRQQQGRQQQQQRQRRQQQQQQQNQPPGLLSNGNNLCYAAASFHLLERVRLDQNLDLLSPRDVAHMMLENSLVVMASDYRNPAIPRFEPTLLVNSYNACLSDPTQQYVGNECAMEFLSSPGQRGGGLLNNIKAAPGFLTTFVLQGACNSCHRQCQMMYPEPVLHLLLPSDTQDRVVHLQPLVAPSMAVPLQNQLICGLPQCGTRQVPATLHLQPGSVLIVNLARLGFEGLITSPVQEPPDGDAAFLGKQLAGVLVSTPGHWKTYLKLRGVWWCVDSVRAHAEQRNPFQCQTPRHLIMQCWFTHAQQGTG